MAALAAAVALAACEKTPPAAPAEPKVESVNDLPPPTNVGPPVNAENYDDGYQAGSKAGETAARAVPARTKAPGADDLTVLALEAAGKDTTRGPRWQRGYASGYKDGFERISLGLK